MELREFLSDVLTQIVGGIADAQRAAGELGGSINPVEGLYSGTDWVKAHRMDENTRCPVEEISFDISVAVEEGSSRDGRIGGRLAVISARANIGSEERSTQTHRLQFKVPVMFPWGERPRSARGAS